MKRLIVVLLLIASGAALACIPESTCHRIMFDDFEDPPPIHVDGFES